MKLCFVASSGGIFTLLSDFVINNSGTVYGAVFDPEMHLIHSCAVSEAERNPMQGSKHVQSNLDHIFLQV